MATAILPDGSTRELPDGSTVYQLAESIGRGLAKAALIGRVDGRAVDLSHKLTGEHQVSIVTDRDPEGLNVLRHSTAHVLAQALRRLYGDGLQYTIGPVIDNGYFYDFEFPAGVKITQDDLPKIEKEMEAIIAADYKFGREDVQPEDARQRLAARGQTNYKKELIDELEKSGETTVSLYEQGDFLDLCRGPHLPGTGKIKSFKLMSIAGAYWRGDSKREQLVRIYGTAFFDKKQLEQHQKMLDEAKKRDHRVVGPALGLYTIDDRVGSGLILWKPKGAIIRLELQKFISEHLSRQGYSQVFTPHIGRRLLYQTSGHYPYYMDSQFPEMRQVSDKSRPLLIYYRQLRDKSIEADPELEKRLIKEAEMDGERFCCGGHDLDPEQKLSVTRELAQTDENYLLKPMNCPHHIAIYASEPHSYRNLPVRLAEFGTVYRWEKSGELGGMTRVRGFTQDDAHLFCTPDQVATELLGCLELVKIVLSTLGMNDYRVRVGLRDPDKAKFVGDADQWDAAEAACIAAAETLGVPFTKEPGEAAFYGPKIDFVVRDVIGREWQLGTVQVDYQLPQRFDLSYVGADNHPHRPVMIHRAPFGSMERFIGVLTEHFAGAFPLWLAPVQVAVLTVSEKTNDYAATVTRQLKDAGLRVELHDSGDKIGAKIRTALMAKTPFLLTVGEKEIETGTVSVRPYYDVEGALKGTLSVADFIAAAAEKVEQKWHPAQPTAT